MSSLSEQLFTRQESVSLREYKSAVILGVGGIGSWVAFILALTGKVQELILVDPDIVELSNLNRTPFRLADVGQPKVAALKYLIIERRAVNVDIYQKKTDERLCTEIKERFISSFYMRTLSNIIDNHAVIIDCRDDAISDFYSIPVKYYKVGYDGLSVTIDGNPRNTAVWGQANTYRYTPSFICPSQLIANLVVTDILTIKDEEVDELVADTVDNRNPFDQLGRINKSVTFDVRDILETMFQQSLNE
jgi:hypothetical protein